jgi:phosphatidylinositol glycan class U
MNLGMSPYIGHTFHESPLFLHFYHLLITNINQFIAHIFIAIDIMTALLLCLLTYNQLNCLKLIEEQRMKNLPQKEDIKKLSINENVINELSLKVAVIYLLSPYSLLSCVGQSTSVFTNFLMSLVLYTSTKGCRILSTALLALLSYQSFYPLMMIIPIIMIIEQQKCLNNNKKDVIGVQYSSPTVRFSMLTTLLYFLGFVFALLFLSYKLMENNFDFIYSTYGFL